VGLEGHRSAAMEVEDRQRHLSSIAVVSAPRAPSVDPIFAVAAAQTSINTLVRFILRLGGRGALDSAQWRRTPASLQQRPPSMRLGRDVARAPSVDTILTAAAAQSSNNTLAVFLPRIGGSRWGWAAIDPATVEANRRPDRRSRGQASLESPHRPIPRQILVGGSTTAPPPMMRRGGGASDRHGRRRRAAAAPCSVERVELRPRKSARRRAIGDK
jgi:hypothetical protein